MSRMTAPENPRAAQYAAAFESAQEQFIELVVSLSDEQWRRTGRNYPDRLNDEDEHRAVGVIAHHVAINTPWIMDRIQRMLDGRPLPPADFQVLNAQHAAEHSSVSKNEVLRLLRNQQPIIAAAVRAIADDQLDQSRDTPAGPMSVAQRLDRVLIGHMQAHRGSIEAATD
jgi:DinB superfamily